LFVSVTAEIKREEALIGGILGILIAVAFGCHCCESVIKAKIS